MKSAIFWAIMLGSSERNLRFGGPLHLRCHSLIVSEERSDKKQEVNSACCLTLRLSCSALSYSSGLKKEEIWLSETLNYMVLQHRRLYCKWEMILLKFRLRIVRLFYMMIHSCNPMHIWGIKVYITEYFTVILRWRNILGGAVRLQVHVRFIRHFWQEQLHDLLHSSWNKNTRFSDSNFNCQDSNNKTRYPTMAAVNWDLIFSRPPILAL